MEQAFHGDCLLPGGRIARATVRFEGRRVVEVRPPRSGDPAKRPGLLVPGLVNAHTHLELSDVGAVDGGDGLPGWVGRQLAARRGASVGAEAARRGAVALVAAGCAAVGDIGAQSSAELLCEAGLSGVAWVELLGLDAAREVDGVARAAALGRVVAGPDARVVERAAAHAPYSTAVGLARAALRPVLGAPGTVHLAEDPAERTFLASASGPWAAVLDRLGVAWRGRSGPGPGPVDWLRAAGALGPSTLAAHGVDLRPDERAALASAGVTICLCPRSNLHIGGVAPDVAALLAAGVPLALGTDSLASSPDLDVLGEIPVLVGLAPEVPVATWLAIATEGGARALGAAGLGVLEVGASPGLLQLDADVEGLRAGAPSRAWLVRPGPPPDPLEAR